MLVHCKSSLTSECIYINANSPSDVPKVVVPRKLGHEYDVEHHCGNFLITSNADDAINFKVVSAPVQDTSKANWIELVPYNPKTQVLDTIPLSDSFIALYGCSSGGYKQIRVLELANGKVKAEKNVTFEEEVYSISPSGSSSQVYGSGVLRISYSSMTTPPQTWEYHLQSAEKKCLKRVSFDGFNPELYKVERIYAKNGDVSVPISLVYRKDLKREKMPLYLYGYGTVKINFKGSYGISIDPSWNPQRFSLLDRGIIFAIAHIRGGGE
jgi:oligopeptidase B